MLDNTLKRADRVLIRIACAMLIAAFSYILVYSAIYTAVLDPDLYFPEHILRKPDPWLINALCVIAGFAALRLAFRREPRIPLKAATCATLLVVLCLGCAWVCVMRCQPRADAKGIYDSATALISGDYAVLSKPDAYVNYYPFQISMIYYSALVQSIFGEECYIALALINVLWLAGAYSALLRLIWQSLKSARVQLCLMLLLMLCTQPVLYCTFLYGNLPGLCCALWALCLMRDWTERAGIARALGAVALIGLSAAIKPNCIIIAIAIAIITVIMAISTKRYRALLLALFIAASPFAAIAGAKLAFEANTGAKLSSGTPQAAFLAMGMQEGPRAAGWFNQYTYNLMTECGLDAGKASEQALRDISGRLAVFRADPRYAASFYNNKLTSQWSETTFESIWVNRTALYDDSRPAIADRLLNGPFRNGIESYQEWYVLLIYLCFVVGLILFCARAVRREAWHSVFGLAVLAVSVLGGFIYHMLFEAKSQYLFIYLPMMLPFAALALTSPLRPAKAPPRS